MYKSITIVLGFVFTTLFAFSSDTGLVQKMCKDEITKLCPDKEHTAGEVRFCLESKKSELSKECLDALNSTGPGKGMRKRLGNKKENQ